MNRTSRICLAVLILLPITLTGCSQEPPAVKRPVKGDVVTPVILLGKTWKQNGPVLVSSRLQVQGPEDEEPQLLQLSEVPYKIVPHATLTFFEGDKKSQYIPDVPLARDC